jgi:acyl transferase domain-containing protein
LVLRKGFNWWFWYNGVNILRTFDLRTQIINSFFQTTKNSCSRAMLANRISFTLGLTGPSFLLDTACSSSMYALDCAFNAIRSGECDGAIVGGSNLLLHPYVTLQFAR